MGKNYSRLHRTVHKLCAAQKMTLATLAAKMGMKQPASLSQMLARDKPFPSTFERIGKAFGMSAVEVQMLYDDPDRYTVTHRFPVELGGRDFGLKIVPVGKNDGILSDGSDSLFDDHIPKEVYAVFSCNGNQLYAHSLQDAKEIVTLMEQLMDTDNKELYNSTMKLLIKHYGIKNEN